MLTKEMQEWVDAHPKATYKEILDKANERWEGSCDLWLMALENHYGFVSCDEHCGALVDPKSFDEVMDAYEHWKSHGNACGCSHGR